MSVIKHQFKSTGFICSSPIYEYENWIFEYNIALGPWPVRKDGELFRRAGKKFWDMFDRFMTEEDQKQYRIGGGCVQF